MCVCCLFKTIVWFFKSSQQRRFSRVVPECLFAQCKGQQMEHYWRPASDFCYWSAITVKSLYCIRGSYCSPQGGKRRGVCTVVYVTTNQGQGLTHTTHTYTHTHKNRTTIISLQLILNEFPALDSHCQCNSDILFFGLLLSVTHLTESSMNSFDTFP